MIWRPLLMVVATLLLAVSEAAGAQAGRLGPAVPPPAIKPGALTLPAAEDGVKGAVAHRKADCGIGTSDTDCSGNAKLVGPTEPAFRYAFVGAIYYNSYDGYQYICTGTLIAPSLVLTAGHCGCGVPGSYFIDFHQDARRSATRGDGIAAVDGAPILYDVRLCRTGNLRGGRDLALLRLRNPYGANQSSPKTAQAPASSSHTVTTSPASEKLFKLEPFPDPPELFWDLRSKLSVGTRLTAVGYGITDQGTSGERREGTIRIASSACEEPALLSTCSAFDEMILADAQGSDPRTDTCGGDSGGPVFLIEQDKIKLIAITSRAAPGFHDKAGGHCGGGGIYALIGRRSVYRWLSSYGVQRGVSSATRQ